jgi:hypothetical protein
MCTCRGITVLALGVGRSMASYSDGGALHSLRCSWSWPLYGCALSYCVRVEPQRHCRWDVRTCSSHADPCSSSCVDLQRPLLCGPYPGVLTGSWLQEPDLTFPIIHGLGCTHNDGSRCYSDGGTVSSMLCSAWCGCGRTDVPRIPSMVLWPCRRGKASSAPSGTRRPSLGLRRGGDYLVSSGPG